MKTNLRNHSDEQSQLQVGLAARHLPRPSDAIERENAQRNGERERYGHDDVVG